MGGCCRRVRSSARAMVLRCADERCLQRGRPAGAAWVWRRGGLCRRVAEWRDVKDHAALAAAAFGDHRTRGARRAARRRAEAYRAVPPACQKAAERPHCTAEPTGTVRPALSHQRALLCRYMPNTPLAVAWIEAAKRLGVPFVAVAAGTASSALADRQAKPPYVPSTPCTHSKRARTLCCAGWRTRAHPCS